MRNDKTMYIYFSEYDSNLIDIVYNGLAPMDKKLTEAFSWKWPLISSYQKKEDPEMEKLFNEKAIFFEEQLKIAIQKISNGMSYSMLKNEYKEKNMAHHGIKIYKDINSLAQSYGISKEELISIVDGIRNECLEKLNGFFLSVYRAYYQFPNTEPIEGYFTKKLLLSNQQLNNILLNVEGSLRKLVYQYLHKNIGSLKSKIQVSKKDSKKKKTVKESIKKEETATSSIPLNDALQEIKTEPSIESKESKLPSVEKESKSTIEKKSSSSYALKYETLEILLKQNKITNVQLEEILNELEGSMFNEIFIYRYYLGINRLKLPIGQIIRMKNINLNDAQAILKKVEKEVLGRIKEISAMKKTLSSSEKEKNKIPTMKKPLSSSEKEKYQKLEYNGIIYPLIVARILRELPVKYAPYVQEKLKWMCNQEKYKKVFIKCCGEDLDSYQRKNLTPEEKQQLDRGIQVIRSSIQRRIDGKPLKERRQHQVLEYNGIIYPSIVVCILRKLPIEYAPYVQEELKLICKQEKYNEILIKCCGKKLDSYQREKLTPEEKHQLDGFIFTMQHRIQHLEKQNTQLREIATIHSDLSKTDLEIIKYVLTSNEIGIAWIEKQIHIPSTTIEQCLIQNLGIFYHQIPKIIKCLLRHNPESLSRILESPYFKQVKQYLTEKEYQYLYLKILQLGNFGVKDDTIQKVLGMTGEELSYYQIMTPVDEINVLNRIIKKRR